MRRNSALAVKIHPSASASFASVACRAKLAPPVATGSVRHGFVEPGLPHSALATTSDLRDSTINVDVANGVITLKGTVTNAAEKTKAKQVADGIEGKKSVVDQLKVAPNDSMTNTSSGNTKSNTNAKK